MGMQNYYRITTKISLDARKLNRTTVITNRLKGISRKGRKLTLTERVRYGKSEMLRYLSGEPIYPIGYVQHKIPKSQGGTDDYENLILVTATIHKLIAYGYSMDKFGNSAL